MHVYRALAKLLLAIVSLLFLACGGGGTSSDATGSPGNQSNDRIAITNDESLLELRVDETDVEIPIDSSGLPRRATAAADSSIQLRLIAEVLPPTLDDQVLQATSIVLTRQHAVVSYNMRGGEYLGGIEIYKINNARNPRLNSQALFLDSDINAVAFDDEMVSDDGYVYAAGSTGDPSREHPAVLEVMRFKQEKLILDGAVQVPLTSFAGTSVVRQDERVYATSGDEGELSVFERGTWNLIESVSLDDARWVDVSEDNVVVVQGTPGRIAVIDEASLSQLDSFDFDGADIPESKSTVQIVGGKAFVAAGSEGVQILSVATGELLGSVPAPDPDSVGLDPSLVVTNAVSVDGDLMFISNGEAGVYVAQAETPFAASDSEAPQEISVVGRLHFDNLQSVNHVAYRDDLLFIASGLGGLKIVRVQK